MKSLCPHLDRSCEASKKPVSFDDFAKQTRTKDRNGSHVCKRNVEDNQGFLWVMNIIGKDFGRC